MPGSELESGYRRKCRSHADIPLPIHMLVTNTLPRVFWSSERPVTTCLTPAAERVVIRGIHLTIEKSYSFRVDGLVQWTRR